MTKTSRIQELLQALAERGYWHEEEYDEVKEIVEMGNQPFEIEGDWGDPGTRKYDRRSDKSGLDDGVPIPRDARTLPEFRDASTTPPRPPAGDAHDHEVRLRQLEAVAKDLMAKLKALEERIIGDRA